MARTQTLAQLRTRVRERCDMENSTFISDAEMNRYIDQSYATLFSKLVDATPDMYIREATITGATDTADYALPDDFYGTYAIEQVMGSGYNPLTRIDSSEAYLYEAGSGGNACAYHYTATSSADQAASKVRLIPTPVTGETYRHKYIYAPTVLDSDAEIVDGVAGWEEWIVLDAAIKCLAKEESSTAILERQLERLDAQIDQMRAHRVAGQVTSVISRQDNPLDPASWFFRP